MNFLSWPGLSTPQPNMRNNLYWNDGMPYELLIKIFSHLNHSDLLQVRAVCKIWHAVTLLPEFMRNTRLIIKPDNIDTLRDLMANGSEIFDRLPCNALILQDLEFSEDLVSILKNLGPNIQSLYFRRSQVFTILNDYLPHLEELILSNITCSPNLPSDDKPLIDLSSFRNFKSLDIGCGSVPDAMRTHMLMNLTRDECPLKMEKLCLEINSEQLFLKALQQHSKSLKHLEMVIFSNITVTTKWREVFALLRHLEVFMIYPIVPICASNWLKGLMESLPSETPLRHCNLNGCLLMNDQLLQFIIHKWPNSLENLDLMFCGSITDDGLKHLNGLRHTLRCLNLSDSGYFASVNGLLMGLAAEKNPVLNSLSLNNISGNDATLVSELVQRLPHLTYLSLENCRYSVNNSTLNSIFRHLLKLKHLKLDECVFITDEGFLGSGDDPAPISNLKSLQSLSLEYCVELSNQVLIEVFKFKELRNLNLSYNRKITTKGIKSLVKNCPAIEELILSNCKRINDDAVMLIAKGFPRLRRLNVSNCGNITSKSLYYIDELCDSLRELCMYGIGWMTGKNIDKCQHLTPQILEYSLP